MKTLIQPSSIFHGFLAIGSVFGCLVGSCLDAVVTPAQAAGLVSIDFESLTYGTALTDQFAMQGVRVKGADNRPEGAIAAPITLELFSNLYQPAAGKVITSGNLTQDLFSDIEFTFTQPIDYFSIWALDVDETMQVHGYYQGNLVESVAYGIVGDTGVQKVQLGQIGGLLRFDRVVLDLVEGRPGDAAGGPELFDNLEFNAPEVLPTRHACSSGF